MAWDHELGTVAKGLIGPIISALIGVLMRHSMLVQQGRRRFWSLALAFELPTVIGMGIIGGGLAAHLGAPQPVAWAISAIMGWLGPPVLSAIFQRITGVAIPLDSQTTNGPDAK